MSIGTDVPNIIDLVKIDTGFIVPPRSAIYAMQFALVQDIAARWRYISGTEWIPVTQGDFYAWCDGIQTGIMFDLSASLGPSPSVIVHYATTPEGFTTE